MKIAICASLVPFSRGGAENLVEALCAELARRGFEADLVTVPFAWEPRLQLLKSAYAWRLLEVRTVMGEEPDLVIATRFPSYLIRHPNKVVWLIHQFRQVYDLLGSRYSDFGDRPEDREIGRMVREMDRRALGESRALHAISRNTAERLRRFNGLDARALYPPSKLDGSLHGGPFGDYVLAVGRIDPLKRFDVLLRAMTHVRAGLRCVIAGDGPGLPALRRLAGELGVGARVEFLGRIDDRRLVDLYAGCLAVVYAPFDEDYGYVTVEAFKAGKPVVTAADSGGVLEFVEDGVNGYVCPPGATARMARAIEELAADRERAARLGAAGRRRVEEITWDRVVTALTGHGVAPEGAGGGSLPSRVGAPEDRVRAEGRQRSEPVDSIE